jgi:hypothetical protein
MEAEFAGLLAWSFLMASAHGTGLMLVPAMAPLCLSGGRAGDLTAAGPLLNSLAAVGVHTLATASVSGIIAILVYDWIGVGFLRRRWINLDWLWTGSVRRYWNDRTRAEFRMNTSCTRRRARAARAFGFARFQ